MEFTQDAPFIKACLAWNKQSGVRYGFTDEELDEELEQLLSSGMFWKMRECRWIRWSRWQQAAIERLWELELYDAGPLGEGGPL